MIEPAFATPDEQFFEHSRDVTRRFLQLVVAVDDQASYGTSDEGEPVSDDTAASARKTVEAGDSDTAPNEEQPQDRAEGITLPDEPPSLTALPELTPPPPDPEDALRGHGLDAKILSDSFAQQGIGCVVLRPDKGDDLNATVGPIVDKADVLILDWVLHRIIGTKTRELIKNTLRSRGDSQLRLINIYTGQKNIADIVLQLKADLEEMFGADKCTTQENSLTCGGTRIVVVGKDLSDDIVRKNGLIKQAELVHFVVDQFARFASGIVRNVALAAMSSLRSNTARLLNTFSRQLDAGYLWNRAVLFDPSNAEEDLVAIVGYEVQDVLDDDNVFEQGGMLAVRTWLPDVAYDKRFGLNSVRTKEHVCEFLEQGTQSPHFGGSKTPLKMAASMFSCDSEQQEAANAQYASLTYQRTRYSTRPPRLQLGTIVTMGDPPNFLLCLQPLCDSLRITGSRAFPMLPIEVSPNMFNIVVKRMNGVMLLLKAKPKLHQVKMLAFTAGAQSRRVDATVADRGFRFVGDDGTEFLWIGELRPDFAARFAQELGTDAARIGIVESEWLLRRKQTLR